MATAELPVNGNYAQQSFDASSYATSQQAPSQNSSTATSEIPKDEVGWYFVEQYYTTLSRTPDKLYLFYNKRSQFVSGNEEDKVNVCVGQKAINDRIKELEFQDTKVRVTNVDSQGSDANIVIQVIGEISNKSQPHKRFVQTFVLAEQTNGYFVLNDIFRYLAEEPEEEEELQPDASAPTAGVQEPAPTAAAAEGAALNQSEDIATSEEDLVKVDHKLEETVKEEQAREVSPPPAAVNGTPVPENAEVAEADEAPAAAVSASEEAPSKEPEVPVEEEAAEPEKPKDPAPTPAPKAATAATPAAPPKPAAPRTWASLAASAHKVATPVVPTTATQASSQPKSTTSTPNQTVSLPPPSSVPAREPSPANSQGDASGWQTAGTKKEQSRGQTQPAADADLKRAYIKNIYSQVEEGALRAALSKFGEIEYLDIHRGKNCAFVDFKTPAAFQAAVNANPHTVNGLEVKVEERKARPQPGFNPNFRGGSGRGRGSFNGQSRGNFPRGGRGGSVRGRAPALRFTLNPAGPSFKEGGVRSAWGYDQYPPATSLPLTEPSTSPASQHPLAAAVRTQSSSSMRPLPGGDAPPLSKPRSRKSSVADPSAAVNGAPSSHVPTTFFMRTEEDMEESIQAPRNADAVKRQRESTFGVQSLADTLEAAFGNDNQPGDSKSDNVSAHTTHSRHGIRRASHDSSRAARREPDSCKSSPPRAYHRRLSNHSVSNPLTPLNADSRSPVPPSAMPSTPTSVSLQSLKLSDEEAGLDEATSQAIVSSGEDEEDNMLEASGSFPQLVMPSLQMPSRRPFTTKGKAMGKLKVLVAGQAGIGKTSLIRSIVQLCEDIVHVDPLSPSNSISQASPPHPKSRKRKTEPSGTPHITETYASTKSYPPWWTDVEESRVLRRRKSSIDAVLERNLCFVDTPGYNADSSKSEDVSRVTDYVESLLCQTTSVTSMDDNDLVGVISGSGGIGVDVVFYLLPPSQDISNDVEFMQRLSALTNVIPVIAKSDMLSAAELVAVKTSILARLQTTSIKPFLFGNAVDDALLAVQGLSLEHSTHASSENKAASEPKEFPFPVPTHPYAVSSTLGPDTETMDASLLMSPDYVQPLVPSELAALVNRVFDPESIAWLRHSAAKKFITWRRRTKLPRDSLILHSLQQQTVQRGSVSSASVGLTGAIMNTSAASSIFSPTSPSGVLVPHAGSPYYTSNLQSPFLASSPSLSHTHPENLDHPTDFSLARYHNTAQGEQRQAEVRIAKWATDLQRSLRNEKDRYEELQRNERAKWLLERVGEEVASGNIVASPGGSPRADWAVIRHGHTKETINAGQRYGRAAHVDSRDPLGLCDFSDEVRRRGFVLVKVLGGVSVLGAVMVTVVRICGWEMGLPEVYSQSFFDTNYPDLSRWTKTIPNAPRACYVTFGQGYSYFASAPGRGSVWAAIPSELSDKVQKAYDTPCCVGLGVNQAWFVMWPDGYYSWKFYGGYGGLDRILTEAEPRSVSVSLFYTKRRREEGALAHLDVDGELICGQYLAISPYNKDHYFVAFHNRTVKYDFTGAPPEWMMQMHEVFASWQAEIAQAQNLGAQQGNPGMMSPPSPITPLSQQPGGHVTAHVPAAGAPGVCALCACAGADGD
ncbi:hypothetical protein N0V90_008553 [Kalmusia sp. IMI 367209]|nr:hypothetical protein N0V90_008553 [Kalmusia sp. IMI 367209]